MLHTFRYSRTLGLSNLPAPASQSTGMTGESHHARPIDILSYSHTLSFTPSQTQSLTVSRKGRHKPSKSQLPDHQALSFTLEYTGPNKDPDARNHKRAHLGTRAHTHTQPESLTHTDTEQYTQSHTERNRYTQLHTGSRRRRTMGALSGLAAAGEEGAAVWTEEAVGLL